MKNLNQNNRAIWSWAMYDWANSAFSTTVMAGFFPVFFKQFWSVGVDATVSTARLGNAISLSSLFIAFLSPSLGALADQRGTKKLFTGIFMLMGVLSCVWMFFIPQGAWISAVLAYSMAMMGFNASCVYYDALLPYLAPGKRSDQVSSLGFSLGYLGGGVLFLINVLMYLYPHFFGLSSGVIAIQISFLMVAIWWFIFSIPFFLFVHEPQVETQKFSLFGSTLKATEQLKSTLKKLFINDRNILYFLFAYWFYIDGVYTVMTMAVDFGMSIGLESKDLIAALLIVQFIGFPFSIWTASLSQWRGTKTAILICIGFYFITVIFAASMTSVIHFYMLALVIGMVQGGVQALSRSLYSRMIPQKASGEYFGLFNLVGKFASILGPALVGWGAYWTGDSRLGMLALLVLFIAGGLLLTKVNSESK